MSSTKKSRSCKNCSKSRNFTNTLRAKSLTQVQACWISRRGSTTISLRNTSSSTTSQARLAWSVILTSWSSDQRSQSCGNSTNNSRASRTIWLREMQSSKKNSKVSKHISADMIKPIQAGSMRQEEQEIASKARLCLTSVSWWRSVISIQVIFLSSLHGFLTCRHTPWSSRRTEIKSRLNINKPIFGWKTKIKQYRSCYSKSSSWRETRSMYSHSSTPCKTCSILTKQEACNWKTRIESLRCRACKGT